jgi:hypothetical protein
MMQLSFQPAFDVFHTAFRFLRLRRLLENSEPWAYDQLRIADYYLLFFFRLEAVRLRPAHRSIKKLAARSPSRFRYEHQPDDKFVFARMKEIQRAAIKTLVLADYFDLAAYERNELVLGQNTESEALRSRLDDINGREIEVMNSLASLINDYSLIGIDGLKHRTGLLEYRYDAV